MLVGFEKEFVLTNILYCPLLVPPVSQRGVVLSGRLLKVILPRKSVLPHPLVPSFLAKALIS